MQRECFHDSNPWLFNHKGATFPSCQSSVFVSEYKSLYCFLWERIKKERKRCVVINQSIFDSVTCKLLITFHISYYLNYDILWKTYSQLYGIFRGLETDRLHVYRVRAKEKEIDGGEDNYMINVTVERRGTRGYRL